MRNRLNKMEPEGKTHYKLYKSGRRWVTAGITVFSVGIGLTLVRLARLRRQRTVTLMRLRTVLLSVPVHQQKLKMRWY